MLMIGGTRPWWNRCGIDSVAMQAAQRSSRTSILNRFQVAVTSQ
jgi:hypothetical protein